MQIQKKYIIIGLLLMLSGVIAPVIDSLIMREKQQDVLALLMEQPRTARASATFTETETLGKLMFEDVSLSEPPGMSCATCHNEQTAFQGNNRSTIAGIARGSRDGHFGLRNVPSLLYAAYTPPFHFSKEVNEEGKEEWKAIGGQFLDGRAQSLSTQMEGPLLDANEMNNSSREMVVDKIKRAPYAATVKKLFGQNVFDNTQTAFDAVTTAIAAFESSPHFAPFSSKFDDVLLGKDKFAPLEAEGFAIFKDAKRGNCMACHAGTEDSKTPADWLFTDYTYDNLGIPRNNAIPANADRNYYDLGLCKQPGLEKLLPPGVEADGLCGAFKVPTLRNVALTAPYGHNGYFSTLRDVVKFYATRDTHPEQWYSIKTDGSADLYNDLPAQYHANVNTSEVPYTHKRGEKPSLSDEEIDALVAFLNTLTDK